MTVASGDIRRLTNLHLTEIYLFFGQPGFGVPVVDLLSTPSTPDFALPARPCAALSVKAYALTFKQERFVSNPNIIAIIII